MARRQLLDLIAIAGLAVAVAGLWQWSQPLAYVCGGLGIAIIAEIIGAFPRNPRDL